MKRLLLFAIIIFGLGVYTGFVLDKETPEPNFAIKSQAVPYNDNSGGYGVFARPNPVLPGNPNFNPTHLPQVQ
jgi:hypothetical protein